MAENGDKISLHWRPGGDLLNARFLTMDPAGLTVRFSAPVGMVLDLGDGSAPETIGEGFVDHAYAAPDRPRPWLFTAVLTDGDGRERGSLRFEVPRMSADPIAVQPAPWAPGEAA